MEANPDFPEVVDQFTLEQETKADTVRQLVGLVESVSGVGVACLQFEALRTATTEAWASDEQFLETLALAWDSCVTMTSGTGGGLSAEETQLINIKDLARDMSHISGEVYRKEQAIMLDEKSPAKQNKLEARQVVEENKFGRVRIKFESRDREPDALQKVNCHVTCTKVLK